MRCVLSLRVHDGTDRTVRPGLFTEPSLLFYGSMPGHFRDAVGSLGDQEKDYFVRGFHVIYDIDHAEYPQAWEHFRRESE